MSEINLKGNVKKITISKQLNDTLAQIQREIIFNKKGNIKKEYSFKNDSLSIGHPSRVTSYLYNRWKRKIVKQTKLINKAPYRTEYFYYNKKGFLIAKEKSDKKDIYFQWHYTYNKANKLIQVIAEDNSYGGHNQNKTIIEYDNLAHKKTTKIYENDSLKTLIQYFYSNNKLIKKQITFSDKSTRIDQFYPNEKLKETKMYDSSKTLKSSRLLIYNEAGKHIKTIVTTNGKRSIIIFKYKYDSHNNWIQKSVYNKDKHSKTITRKINYYP